MIYIRLVRLRFGFEVSKFQRLFYSILTDFRLSQVPNLEKSILIPPIIKLNHAMKSFFRMKWITDTGKKLSDIEFMHIESLYLSNRKFYYEKYYDFNLIFHVRAKICFNWPRKSEFQRVSSTNSPTFISGIVKCGCGTIRTPMSGSKNCLPSNINWAYCI